MREECEGWEVFSVRWFWVGGGVGLRRRPAVASQPYPALDVLAAIVILRGVNANGLLAKFGVSKRLH